MIERVKLLERKVRPLHCVAFAAGQAQLGQALVDQLLRFAGSKRFGDDFDGHAALGVDEKSEPHPTAMGERDGF